MPGLRRNTQKREGHKQRVVIEGAAAAPEPAVRPRAYQMPAVNPEPFAVRSAPEPELSADLPLWPGWNPDPTGRHESRYFDGVAWTENVVDGKNPSKDALSD